MLTTIAVPWFVLETTGSAGRAAVIAFATRVAVIPASFVGGALADRFGAKRISVLGDLLSGATVALVPLLYAVDALQLWHLFALMLLGAVLDYPGAIARSALLPELADRGRVSYERANSADSGATFSVEVVGAPFAGLLITLLGAANVLWFDAVTFAVSALVVAVLVPSITREAPRDEPLFSHAVEGLRFIRRDRLISWLLLTSMVSNFVLAPLSTVLIPLYALQEFGDPARFGLIVGAGSVGALGGSLFFGAVGPRLPRRATYLAVYAGMCGVWLTLAFVPPYAVFVAAFAFSTFLSATVNPLLQTIRQERVPPELRGRVFGTVLSFVVVASPFGLLVGGLIAEVGGVEAGFAFAFVAYSAITLGAALNPVLKEMNLRRERADVVESPTEQVLAEVEQPGPQTGAVDLTLPASRTGQSLERSDEDGELEVDLRDPGR
jgi:MFS family permease